MKRVQKVFAYITSADTPARLLVFAHPDAPQVGIQVPGGTVEASEELDRAVFREANEETGLTGLRVRRFLGTAEFDMSAFGRDELHVRHFYHLEWPHTAGERWRHQETGGGKHAPIEFELFWASFPDSVPELFAGHGALLSELARSLSPRPR